MKQKNTFSITIAFFLTGLCFTASAQDKMKNQPNPASSATAKTSSYQMSKQQLATPATTHESNVPATGMKENVTTGSRGKASAPKSMEQLRYEKKQAAEKGLSTEKYDAAINEILLNQSK